MATPQQEEVLRILNDPEAFIAFDPATLQATGPQGGPLRAPAAVPAAITRSVTPEILPPAFTGVSSGPAPVSAPSAFTAPTSTAGGDPFAAPAGEDVGKGEEIARVLGRTLIGLFGPEVRDLIDSPFRGADPTQSFQGPRGGITTQNLRTGETGQTRAQDPILPDLPKPLTNQPIIGDAFLDTKTDETVVASTENIGQITADPGRFEPLSGRGQSITTNVNVDNARELTNKSLSDLQDRVRRAPEIIERMANMDRLFEAGFQTLFGSGGEVRMAVLTGIDRVAPNLLLPERVAEVQKRTEFKQEAFANINAIIREITGAQMSEKEAERIVRQLPDPRTDSPIEFKTKMDNSRIKIGLSFLRDRQLMAEGQFPEKAEDVLTLKDVRDGIVKEWDDIAVSTFNAAKEQGLSRDDAKQAARLATDQLMTSKYGGLPIEVLKRIKDI